MCHAHVFVDCNSGQGFVYNMHADPALYYTYLVWYQSPLANHSSSFIGVLAEGSEVKLNNNVVQLSKRVHIREKATKCVYRGNIDIDK